MLGLAITHLKRGETEEALKAWLSAIDHDPKNRIAKNGLEFLRRQGDDLHELTESARIRRLYPGTGFRIPWFIPLILIVAFVGVTGFFTVPPFLEKILENRRTMRPGIEQVAIEELSGPITEYGGQFTYIHSEKEIRNIFKKAQDYFHAYQDNLAQRELNRLLNSNASQAVKEKARILMGFVKEPNFATLKDSFSYAEVKKEPLLYQNCFVRWKGKVSNISIGDIAITFDFLVGYEDEKILEGIVPVHLEFAAKLNPMFPVEILGKVEVEGGKLKSIKGISLHELAPKDKS